MRTGQGALLNVTLDTSEWDESFCNTVALLKDMGPLMDAIGQHMKASIMQTLKEGGPPGKPFAPLADGSGRTPLWKTGTTIAGRIEVAEASADSVSIGSGFAFSHIHQFGATIKAKNKPLLAWKTAEGGWAHAKEVTIPARPFMTFRPEDPEKIAELAAGLIEQQFGGGAGGFWRKLF